MNPRHRPNTSQRELFPTFKPEDSAPAPDIKTDNSVDLPGDTDFISIQKSFEFIKDTLIIQTKRKR